MAMKVGILGSGTVGQALAIGFLKSGHEVMVGTRNTKKLADWLENEGEGAEAGSFAQAAKFGQMLVLCCRGMVATEVISMASKDNFTNKILIDVTNPLIFEKEGVAPKPAYGFPDSLGLRVQKTLPKTKVVKAFNIVGAPYMCNPNLAEGTPDMFIAGNDIGAKEEVTKIAEGWGWPVNDIGGIEQAYLLEALAMLWIRYAFNNNHWVHAFKLLKK